MYRELPQSIFEKRDLFSLRSASKPYSQRVRDILGSSLIAYWKLDEASGTVAADSSGSGFNGTYSNVTLGQPSIGGKTLSALFVPGSNPYCNFYSAGFNGAFNNQEGTLQFIMKPVNAAFWTDGVNQFRQLTISADANNRIIANKIPGGPNELIINYIAGSNNKQVLFPTTATGGTCFTFTWSKSNDRIRGYINSVKQGLDVNGLGVWVGALAVANCVIGAASNTGNLAHSGWISNVLIANREATQTEVTALMPPLV